MKRFLFSWVLTLVFVLNALAVGTLEEFLNRKEVKEVRVLDKDSSFETMLEVMIEQPLDHQNPEGPTFNQRVYISHIDPDKPVVMVTAGYDARFYYTSEITRELECNQLMVEHRYFGKSVPDSLDWTYLNTWQAASDHHRIIGMFKEIYPGPWITTGISKGGQTVMYHSYYYPDDVDVRVPYVAPLNFGLEDERVYRFLEQVGPKRERRRVFRFQRMALKHQQDYLPAFKQFSEKKGYTYQWAGGIEKAFEYCVLEYSFAYWQWGYATSAQIPRRSASAKEVIAHMNEVAGFDYFSDEFVLEYRPFFYQVLTEMGYYGYDLEPFGKYLQHVDNPIFTFTFPETLPFNEELSVDLMEYVSRDANNFIYIYGEYDAWSATAVRDIGSTNSRIFFKEGGSHRTRISNMPAEQREEVFRTLTGFLD